MRKIKKIEAVRAMAQPRKKVAAYARISLESERMNHSLSAQISYYNDFIQRNPEWEFAGVYADEGISGTSIKKRSGFQQMLADCEAGRIDMVITKSIQRFARNTLDLLRTIRHLKELGIEVWFEKENIHTLSGEGELMLSILASFAQEESRSISDNVKWAKRKRFAQGLPNGHFYIYGYRWEGDRMVIVPEEAAVVKRIYQNFLDGKSRLETERELEAEGIRTRQGCVMRDSNLKRILTNITYTGNLLLQKAYIEDPITKKTKWNRGELPQYWVENTHEAIIDMETFQYVQEEMARRKELGPFGNKSIKTSCFTGKLKCPYCQISYMHDVGVYHGHSHDFWVCGSKKKKKVGDGCPVRGSINHKNMVQAATEVLGLEEFDEDVFLQQVDHIEVPKAYTLMFYMADGRKIEKACPNTGRRDCWTEEYRARASAKRRKNPRKKFASALTGMLKCTICGCNFQRSVQPGAMVEKLHYWRCAGNRTHEKTGMREDALKPQLAKAIGEQKWNGRSFKAKVDHVDVGKGNMLEIFMKDGSKVDMAYVPPKKVARPLSKEQRLHLSKLARDIWTPEKRAEMSRYLKQLRKERGPAWKKEK